MDRNNKIKFAALVILIFCQSIAVSTVIAAPTPIGQNTQTNSANIEKLDKSAPTDNSINHKFPYLQRALIIATIVNLVIIVFALTIYIVKRRMTQFSPIAVAKARQES